MLMQLLLAMLAYQIRAEAEVVLGNIQVVVTVVQAS
jgi:hypothetical protein